jgi:hypothetical protein
MPNKSMTGKILSDTMIKGEPVSAGEMVEVDEATYRALKSANRIEKCEKPSAKKSNKESA